MWLMVLSVPISIVICYFFYGRIIGKLINIDLPNGERDITIDGVRGFLALLVMSHHYFIFYNFINSGHWLAPTNNFMRNIGVFSVYVFFIITGYLFIGRVVSLNNSGKKPNWVRIFKSRVFRILPLYLFVISITYFLAIFNDGVLTTGVGFFKEISHWLTFTGWELNGDAGNRLIHAGVTWTLKYEWLFYFLLPLVFIIIQRKILVCITTLLMLLLFTFPIHNSLFDTRLFSLFFIGGLVATIRINGFNKNKKIDTPICSIIIISLVLISLLFNDCESNLPLIFSSGIFFYAISNGNSLFGLLKTKISRVLGEISYSIYLTHGVVIYTLFIEILIPYKGFSIKEFATYLPMVMVLVTFISTLLFKYIEMPFIKLGKKDFRFKKINLTDISGKLN